MYILNGLNDGNLNVAYNCIDRHAEKNPSDILQLFGKVMILMIQNL